MEGRDLLVASAGGHLTQLRLLADRLRPRRPRTWVTYDHPQAASLLAGEHVIHGVGPSSRSVRAAVGNWRLSADHVVPGRIDRVISTGSAIAVPFLLRAELRGIEGHYIESATRSEGPSLSGRILTATTRRVGLHTQHGDWAGDRWQAVDSVFDGFRAHQGTRSDGPLRVVVSLGTNRFSFERVLDWISSALRHDDDVLLQHGATRPRELRGRVRQVHSLPAADLDAELSAADVVVGHAGTGLALTALQHRRAPVLFARAAAYGEHVDDHQQQTLQSLAGRGLALAPPPERLDRDALLAAAGTTVDLDAETSPLVLRPPVGTS